MSFVNVVPSSSVDFILRSTSSPKEKNKIKEIVDKTSKLLLHKMLKIRLTHSVVFQIFTVMYMVKRRSLKKTNRPHTNEQKQRKRGEKDTVYKSKAKQNRTKQNEVIKK